MKFIALLLIVAANLVSARPQPQQPTTITVNGAYAALADWPTNVDFRKLEPRADADMIWNSSAYSVTSTNSKKPSIARLSREWWTSLMLGDAQTRVASARVLNPDAAAGSVVVGKTSDGIPYTVGQGNTARDADALRVVAIQEQAAASASSTAAPTVNSNALVVASTRGQANTGGQTLAQMLLADLHGQSDTRVVPLSTVSVAQPASLTVSGQVSSGSGQGSGSGQASGSADQNAAPATQDLLALQAARAKQLGQEEAASSPSTAASSSSGDTSGAARVPIIVPSDSSAAATQSSAGSSASSEVSTTEGSSSSSSALQTSGSGSPANVNIETKGGVQVTVDNADKVDVKDGSAGGALSALTTEASGGSESTTAASGGENTSSGAQQSSTTEASSGAGGAGNAAGKSGDVTVVVPANQNAKKVEVEVEVEAHGADKGASTTEGSTTTTEASGGMTSSAPQEASTTESTTTSTTEASTSTSSTTEAAGGQSTTASGGSESSTGGVTVKAGNLEVQVPGATKAVAVAGSTTETITGPTTAIVGGGATSTTAKP